MATERKPRPPVPPKKKPRSFSEQSGYEENANDSFEYRNFQTLPNKGVGSTEAKVAKNSKAGLPASSPQTGKLREENTGTMTRHQAPPPEDCLTVLNLPPVEPQTFQAGDTAVFFTCSSLPSNSSCRGGSSSTISSEVSELDFKYLSQTSSADSRSQSIPEHLEDAGFRRCSHVAAAGEAVGATSHGAFQANLSSLSMRIEPSPERTLSHSGGKNFASDPDILESVNTQDPDDKAERRKSVKGRGQRPSMLMLSKSLANLHSPEELANKSVSPEKKKKVDIDKLNRFFGESKETATEIEANIYHLLISGNQLKESSPGAADGNSRTKKSASTWFLSPKALESLPEKPMDAQFVPKIRKSVADDLLTLKSKSGLTEKGKQIMKSFKRRVVGVANLAEGLTPAEEIHGTFCIPIEECVMSSEIKFVPLLVEKCVKVIEELGLEVEGIYRLSGNGSSINELQEELDREPVDIDVESERWNEVHVVTNILKLYFRKLPDSLITDELYEAVIQLSSIPHWEKRLLKLKVLLGKLPKVNFETFKFLSRHLHKVASFWNVNKMDAHNLAIMFGPTLVRSPKDQTLIMIKDMHFQTTIVETIIKHSKWLFNGWSGDRSVPMDETSADDSTYSTSNLQLLESAETLVARQLRVVPVEEKSTFFSGPNRRSKRRHRNKSGKDESNETEQKAVPDVDREIEVQRVKIPELPFKNYNSLQPGQEQFRRTLFDGRTKVKRSATERLDAKTLDIRLVSSNKLGDEKDGMLQKTGEDTTKTDSEKFSPTNAEGKGVEGSSTIVEIKKYSAYDADVRAATLTKHNAVQQPTILRKYSSKPNLGPIGYDSGSLSKSSYNSLKKYGSQSLAQSEKETQSRSSQYKQSKASYHPDVSQLPRDGAGGGEAYWENGGSLKRTNIVVRGPSGRRYCVLSGTDPSVLLDGVVPTDEPLQVVKYIDKKQCAMTCVINVKLNIVQEAGSHDIELCRLQYA